jgi:hypothetical protein
MKEVKAKLQESNPDRVAAFEAGASKFAKKVIGNFKDYEFVSNFIHFIVPSSVERYRSQSSQQYTGESMNPDGLVALLNYREDGVTRTSAYLFVRCNCLINLSSLLHLLEGWS